MSANICIDSHHHFWRLDRGDYHWLTEDLEDIRKDFLPEDLVPLLESCGIQKTILVQAAESVEESDFILSLAEEHAFIAGVVAWVDMASASSIEVLERWRDHPYFLGIRPVIQDIADVNWVLKPELDWAFKWLINNDFSFDALVKPAHLPNLITLVDRYPELRVVIDHGAKPDIAAGDMALWADHMAELAKRPQIFCKLSGLVTEAGSRLSYESLEPYMSHLLECFGAERLMWGSDWPVCTLAASYNDWVAWSRQFIASLSEDAQAHILGETALRFYKPRALVSEL